MKNFLLFCFLMMGGLVAAQMTLFKFEFQNTEAVTTNNTTSGTPTFSIVGMLTTPSYFSANNCGSGLSRSHAGWNTGEAYRFTTSTTGFESLEFSACIRSSNADVGPFIIRASIDETNWTTIVNSFTPGTSFASSVGELPADFDDQATVYIEVYKTTDAGDSANNIRIDNALLIGTATALPITLLSFTAERRGEQALISWSTSAEEENDYMAVERSQDGINFREIGRVSGAGTTDFVQRYSFLDERPAAGLNYYRLRQVDFDGSFEYHRIATVDFRSGAATGTQVYPNPTKGDLYLSAPLADEAELLLLNAQGQVVRQFDASQAKAQNSLRTASLPAGVYFLRIASGGEAETLRFVKE